MENLVRLTCFAVILLLGKEQAYAFSPPAPSTTNSHLVSAARNRANLASSGCLRHKSFSLAPKSFQPSLFLRSNRKLKHVVASSRGSVDPNLDAEKYTEKAFEALQRLTDVAEKFSQQYIEADLLFYSLLQDETVQRILSKAAGKGSFSSMMRQLAQAFEEYARGLPQILGSAASTKQMGVTLRDALKEAQTLKGQYGDSYISVEHLLVAAIASPRMRKTAVSYYRKLDDGATLADLLERFGITQAAVEKAIEEVRGGQKVTSRTPEATYDALNKYGRDLTEEAKAGKLDPVIGRDEVLLPLDVPLCL